MMLQRVLSKGWMPKLTMSRRAMATVSDNVRIALLLFLMYTNQAMIDDSP